MASREQLLEAAKVQRQLERVNEWETKRREQIAGEAQAKRVNILAQVDDEVKALVGV
jgi:hypothetical protein